MLDGPVRMFVAVRPPAPVTEDLDAFLDVRREAAGLRWTTADQMHVTLAFLADVPDRALDDLVDRLGRAATRRTPFEAVLAGGGAFPHPDRGRVLYAALDLDATGRTELGRLATGCRAAANRAGAPSDGERFRPHLTVARSRRPVGLTSWVRLLDAYRGPAWEVAEVELVASYLGEGARRRPRHEVVERFTLG